MYLLHTRGAGARHQITIQTKICSSEFNFQEAKEQIKWKCLVLVTWNSQEFCGRGKEKGSLFHKLSLGSREGEDEYIFLLVPILFFLYFLYFLFYSLLPSGDFWIFTYLLLLLFSHGIVLAAPLIHCSTPPSICVSVFFRKPFIGAWSRRGNTVVLFEWGLS